MSKNKTLLVNNDYYFLKSIQINKPSKKDWRHQRNLKKKNRLPQGVSKLKRVDRYDLPPQNTIHSASA
jgi:hypothetical protein